MITPLLHRIIVKPDKFKEVNKDYQRAKAIGLEIPELEDMKRAQASVDRGVVVSLGATAYKDFGCAPPIKPGDVINYARFSGKLITDSNDEEYVCLNDEDIICIIKD
jgi:co-chaperonin GroES (HSP10)